MKRLAHSSARHDPVSVRAQGGTILFLYLTHKLISLRPSDSGTEGACRQSVEAGGAVHSLFGRTSLPAIEAAYDKVAEAYSVWSTDD